MGAEGTGADAFFDAYYFAAVEAVGGGGEQRVTCSKTVTGARWGRFIGKSWVSLEL